MVALAGCGGGVFAGGNGGGPQHAITHFSVSGPTSAASGTAISFTVSAMDASNVVVTNYSGTVHLQAQTVRPCFRTILFVERHGQFLSDFQNHRKPDYLRHRRCHATILGVSNTIQVAGVASSSVFSATGSMTFARKDHTATSLNDSRVLVTGGDGRSGPLGNRGTL